MNGSGSGRADVPAHNAPQENITTWVAVAQVEEIQEGHCKLVTFGSLEVAIYNISGELFALSNICSHRFARLSFGRVDGAVVTCPLHQAKFDIRTGAVLEAPARKALPTYPIKVEHETVYLHLPPQ